ncbi:MAG: S-ribosylhomocysteine lyase LuxS involved in autoinducer biosynthesis [Candidatus Deianiraeaceae bacterium]
MRDITIIMPYKRHFSLKKAHILKHSANEYVRNELDIDGRIVFKVRNPKGRGAGKFKVDMSFDEVINKVIFSKK